MKSLQHFFLTAFLSVILINVNAHTPQVINTKHKNLFVLKADKSLLGAKVEVLHSSGQIVTAQRLHRKKLVIDFCDVKSGSYTIRVSKGDQVNEFTYERLY